MKTFSSLELCLKPVLLFVSLSAAWALAEPRPDSCEELTRQLQEEPYRQRSSHEHLEGEPMHVVGSAVMLRAAPDPTAPVLQKLGYGVQVGAVSRACGEWTLVSSPYGGGGFVREDLLRAEPYDEATLSAKQAQAPSTLEQALWALARAHFFPSDRNLKEALELQTRAREALSPKDEGRCESYVGACEVLLKESLYLRKRLDSDPKVGQVPVGPWWMLPTPTDAAQAAVFRGAYVYTSGECNCCGCESCQTNLQIDFEALGKRGRTRPLAASRRPPPSWFRSLSTAGCAKAEQAVRQSSQWDVPHFEGDPKQPATPGDGNCIPGDDGSVWWQQEWHHPEMSDMEDNSVLRTYRIVKGRVVDVGKLKPALMRGPKNDTVAWTTERIVAWRDLDGDGRPDAVVPCPYGSYCTQAKGFTR
jgi:hypothetical protein